jgi:DNA-binding CsgD family transcriptional regulator
VQNTKDYLCQHRKLESMLSEVYNNITKNLQINHVSYSKFFHNDYMVFRLVNNSDFLEDYLLNIDSDTIYFKEFIAKETFNNNEYYFFSWPDVPETKSMYINYQHQNWNAINIAKINSDNLEIWSVGSISLMRNFFELAKDSSYRKKILISLIYLNNEVEKNISFRDIKNILPQYSKAIDIPEKLESAIAKIKTENNNIKSLLKCYYPKGIEVKSINGLIKLTNSELAILSLLAKGFQAKQIQQKMNISTKTVEYHKANIKTKTGYYLNSDLIELFNNQIVDYLS